MAPLLNAMTIDVEDYFHVSAFAHVVSPTEWPSFESRVCRNTERLLGILDDANVRATFFVLGWVAERYPQLVSRIERAGHELASHSFDHALVYDKTPEAFRADLQRARAAIAEASGVVVTGYRAPSFSLVQRSLWALDVLIDEGYTYDSSIYPIRHDRYGIPAWSRFIHRVDSAAGTLWELPGSTVRYLGVNMPMGGGGYFRLLPYRWTSMGIRRLNQREGQPAIFYLHPWEVDPDQPRLRANAPTRLRHYRNLDQTEPRLRRLLKEFPFGRIEDVLAERPASATPAEATSPTSAATR